MKTLLNLLSNLLKLIGKGFNLFVSLSVVIASIVIFSSIYYGYTDATAWAITFIMGCYAVAVLLPDEEDEESDL